MTTAQHPAVKARIKACAAAHQVRWCPTGWAARRCGRVGPWPGRRSAAFAHDADTVPIWICFGKGGTDAPDGVAVINLRAVVSSIQDTAAEPADG